MAKVLRRSIWQLFKQQKMAQIAFLRHKSEKNILKSAFNDISVMNCTVNDFVYQNLDRWPDKTATVCAVTGHGYTYAQTYRMSVTFAASLRKKMKLREDDTVAIILPNVPEYPCIMLGALQAGCVVSPMNPVYTSDDLKRQFDLIDCKAVIASKLSYPNIKKALDASRKNIPVILIDNDGLPEGTIKFAELAEDMSMDTDCLKSVERRPEDIAILPFSSGTTGFPKAVVLTQRNIVAANQIIAQPDVVVIEETTATTQAVLPAVLPFFHIFGMVALMMNQLHFGCKLVTLPYFKPELFLQTLVKQKANVLFMVPPMAVFLGKHPAVTAAHLESVYGIICGAAPLSEADAAAVLSKNKNINFRQGYGLTETTGGISIGKRTDKNHAAVGHIFSNHEVIIADVNTKEPLGPGQDGEIWFRGPMTMREYYKDEASTRDMFTDDGWLRTGDIGRYDENQYLYVTDRLKELIKVKGFQVAPAELETIIRGHPEVLDCAVLGVPDDISGELPRAFFVPRPGSALQPSALVEYVNNKVAVFKKLKDAQIIPEIPKTAAGKILRKDLKAKYC